MVPDQKDTAMTPPDLTPPQERAVRLALALAAARQEIHQLEQENHRLRLQLHRGSIETAKQRRQEQDQ